MMKFIGPPGLNAPGTVTWKRYDYDYRFGEKEAGEKKLLPLVQA